MHLNWDWEQFYTKTKMMVPQESWHLPVTVSQIQSKDTIPLIEFLALEWLSMNDSMNIFMVVTSRYTLDNNR